jgi:hypothetical protein
VTQVEEIRKYETRNGKEALKKGDKQETHLRAAKCRNENRFRTVDVKRMSRAVPKAVKK